MINLDADIKFLKGVGEKKAELLKKELNITTVRDFLYYFPYKYVDKTHIYKVNEINSQSSYIQLKGKITSFRTEGKKPKDRLIATFVDDTGSIELVWFKGQKYVEQNYKINTDYLVFGKPNVFNYSVNIPHPELDLPNEHDSLVNLALEAHYNTSERMKSSFLNSKAIRKIMISLLTSFKEEITETLPEYLLAKLRYLPLHDSIVNIHFPKNNDLLAQAELRLKFEELFFIQLRLLIQRNNQKYKSQGHIFSKVGDYFNGFYKNNLPFELTGAQKRVVKEIRINLGSGKQMNRLLQGDVGSGKTLVALMCMLLALDNGFQACIMAPTEILAQQHFKTILEMLEGMNINCKLLTGSSRKKERDLISNELIDGSLQILIGTHALIEDKVAFANLGLVIIDEQDRKSTRLNSSH